MINRKNVPAIRNKMMEGEEKINFRQCDNEQVTYKILAPVKNNNKINNSKKIKGQKALYRQVQTHII